MNYLRLKQTGIIIITFSLLIMPFFKPISTANSSFSLIPPACFISEAYTSKEQISADDIINNKEIKIEVRFKVIDLIKQLFKKSTPQ